MSLQLLSDVPMKEFLAHYWQKRPCLIRQALPGFKGIVRIPELLRFSCRSEVESRLVIRDGSRWQLRHGPFRLRDFARMPAKNWTLLVQGMNLHHDGCDSLLQNFSFITRARLDDLMVSFAAPGGGVGPHVDSYDVFLLQGQGRRRWRIGPVKDARVRPKLPLAILARFTHENQWILHPGDMLYVPPGYGHDGVALERCTTYSIGFRAPGARQLAAAFLDGLEEMLERRVGDGRYKDAETAPERKPGRIPDALVEFGRNVAGSMRLTPREMESCLGRYLSEPKPHVRFEPPERPLTPSALQRRFSSAGAVLDRRTLLLYRNGRFFVNGEAVQAVDRDRRPLERLADSRCLDAATEWSSVLLKHLHHWYVEGWLHPGTAHAPGQHR